MIGASARNLALSDMATDAQGAEVDCEGRERTGSMIHATSAVCTAAGMEVATMVFSKKSIRQWREVEVPHNIEDYPPIMTVHQAARMLQISPSTLYSNVSRGRYKHATKRGNPLRFNRDVLLREFFKGG